MDNNTVSVKEYLNSRVDEIKESIKIAFSSMEKRLEGMNEFRDTLRDQAGQFITRDIYDNLQREMQRQIDELRLSKATLEGKASQQAVNVAFMMSVLGLLVAIAAIVLHFIP